MIQISFSPTTATGLARVVGHGLFAEVLDLALAEDATHADQVGLITIGIQGPHGPSCHCELPTEIAADAAEQLANQLPYAALVHVHEEQVLVLCRGSMVELAFLADEVSTCLERLRRWEGAVDFTTRVAVVIAGRGESARELMSRQGQVARAA